MTDLYAMEIEDIDGKEDKDEEDTLAPLQPVAQLPIHALSKSMSLHTMRA